MMVIHSCIHEPRHIAVSVAVRNLSVPIAVQGVVRRSLLAGLVLILACAPQTAAPTTPATTAPVLGSGIIRIASMGAAKATHTATRLLDGRVLIAGGYDGSCHIRETELYTPATRTFAAAAPLGVARCDHTATLLADGRVLIAGGIALRETLRTAELYDPSRDAFIATGDMTLPRDGPTATLLRDGTVLVTGGIDEGRPVASAERYDPAKRTFTRVGDMRVARMAHTATLLADGRVLVVGGSSSRGQIESSAEIFDPSTGEFAPTKTMTVPRYKHAAVALADSRVLIVGGSDARDFAGRYATAEIFDPRDGEFHVTAPMSSRRYKVTSAVAALATGEVLVAGGADIAEVFDGRAFVPVSGTLDANWSFAAATPLLDGSVLITGGYDDRIRPTAGAWLFRR